MIPFSAKGPCHNNDNDQQKEKSPVCVVQAMKCQRCIFHCWWIHPWHHGKEGESNCSSLEAPIKCRFVLNTPNMEHGIQIIRPYFSATPEEPSNQERWNLVFWRVNPLLYDWRTTKVCSSDKNVSHFNVNGYENSRVNIATNVLWSLGAIPSASFLRRCTRFFQLPSIRNLCANYPGGTTTPVTTLMNTHPFAGLGFKIHFLIQPNTLVRTGLLVSWLR